MFSSLCFLTIDSSKPKDSLFTVKNDKGKLKSLTFNRMEADYQMGFLFVSDQGRK